MFTMCNGCPRAKWKGYVSSYSWPGVHHRAAGLVVWFSLRVQSWAFLREVPGSIPGWPQIFFTFFPFCFSNLSRFFLFGLASFRKTGLNICMQRLVQHKGYIPANVRKYWCKFPGTNATLHGNNIVTVRYPMEGRQTIIRLGPDRLELFQEKYSEL